jgi:hypothetical protein
LGRNGTPNSSGDSQGSPTVPLAVCSAWPYGIISPVGRKRGAFRVLLIHTGTAKMPSIIGVYEQRSTELRGLIEPGSPGPALQVNPHVPHPPQRTRAHHRRRPSRSDRARDPLKQAGRYHVDEIIADPMPSGTTRGDGKVVIEPDPWDI